jgi:hypothetical protein
MLLYISEIGEFWCKSGVGREHIRRRCTRDSLEKVLLVKYKKKYKRLY